MTTKDKIEVMEAHERGEAIEYRASAIEYRASNDDWRRCASEPKWNWEVREYRVAKLSFSEHMNFKRKVFARTYDYDSGWYDAVKAAEEWIEKHELLGG